MSEVSDRFVAVLDANVLFPFGVRDVLLWFTHAGLYRARWSEQIVAEWHRSLVAKRPGVKASVEQQIQVMRNVFPEAWVADYADLVEVIELPDVDDRHVLAAAIRCGAQNIVTENIKHFPSEALGKYDIEAVTADHFLTCTFELYPLEAMKVLKLMRVGYRSPEYTKTEFLRHLMRIGLGQLALRVKGHIELL
ncbi:MAG: PIN domain-containing protein [Alphaproteobacteria bacterium]|nr:PIN domain-containing protein [Alphaproteobacteria bacterium]